MESVTMKPFGIEYEHNFAIIDFGKHPSYKVILSRTLMRQIRMVQDWGYNYYETAITRVDLKNRSHRDVTHTLTKEFNFAFFENLDSLEKEGRAHLWMFGASKTSTMIDISAWCKEVYNLSLCS